jgi:hypothetical protein
MLQAFLASKHASGVSQTDGMSRLLGIPIEGSDCVAISPDSGRLAPLQSSPAVDGPVAPRYCLVNKYLPRISGALLAR